MTNVRYNGKLKNVVVFNDKKNDIRNWLKLFCAIYRAFSRIIHVGSISK